MGSDSSEKKRDKKHSSKKREKKHSSKKREKNDIDFFKPENGMWKIDGFDAKILNNEKSACPQGGCFIEDDNSIKIKKDNDKTHKAKSSRSISKIICPSCGFKIN